MKIRSFQYRTSDEEIMDDFDLNGSSLKKTLKDLDKVNKWLGGNKITKDGVRKLIKGRDGKITIMDVGCGNGMVLREIAISGRKNGRQFKLIGIDANEHAIEIAREESSDYPEIKYFSLNIFSEAFQKMEADIILCTLTLHHFEDEKIKLLLRLFLKNCRLGVVINDLERTPIAYYLFKIFCAVFINNEIARKDGLISIRRGFKIPDLKRYGSGLNVKQEIKWKWAFRYQWILYKK